VSQFTQDCHFFTSLPPLSSYPAVRAVCLWDHRKDKS
jgi:hypothetical protein